MVEYALNGGMLKMSVKDSVVSMVKTPLGAVLILVITLILSGLSIASAISGELTAAAVSAAGLVVIILIIAMINIAVSYTHLTLPTKA